MVSKEEKTRINRELKGIIDEYKRNYEKMRRISEEHYKTTLKAGETFNPHEGFYFDEDRRAFQAICDSLKDRANEVIRGAALQVMAQNTAAPSTEATNVITLLNSRQNVSADEIDQLMTKYGADCPMVYNALLEKADSLGYHDFRPHPVTAEAESIEAMANIIDKTFIANRAEHNMVSTTAAFTGTADAAFPAEE